MTNTLTRPLPTWLQSCPFPALGASADGHFGYANERFLESFGWSEDVLAGDPTRLCAPGEWMELCRRLHSEVPSERSLDREVVFLDSLGQPHLCSLAILPSGDSELGALVFESTRPAEDLTQLPSLFETATDDASSARTRAHPLSPYLRIDVEFDPDFSSARLIDWEGHVPGLTGIEPSQAPRLEELLDANKWMQLRTELSCQAPGNAVKLVPMDLSLRMLDGNQQWFNVAIENRPDRGPQHWSIEGWNISRRHREETCRQLSSHLMSILNVDADFEDLAPDVMEYLRLQLELDMVAVHYLRPSGESASFCAGRDETSVENLHELRVSKAFLGDGPDGQLEPEQRFASDHGRESFRFTSSGSAWAADIADARDDDPGLARLVDEGYASLAVTPIRSGGRSIGILLFLDRATGRFDDEFVQLLEELVFSIGNAIQRENSIRAIRRSEDRYRGLFESSRDGIAIRDLGGSLQAANRAYLGLTNFTVNALQDLPRTGYLSLAAPEEPGVCYPGNLLRDGYTEDHEMVLTRQDGERIPVLGREWVIGDESGRPTRAMEILRDISDTKQAEMERQRLVTAIDQADEIMVITDSRGSIQYVNPAFERVTGYSREEALGKNPKILKSDTHDDAFYEELWQTISQGETWKGRFTNKKKNGELFQEDATISPICDDSGRITNYVAVKRDVTELVELESQLLQAQKLESIGRLAAGIAHEINTPSQYVGDNVQFLSESVGDLMELLTATVEFLKTHDGDDTAKELMDQAEELDLEFLQEEIPSAIEQSQEGLSRITEIVGAMKSFSHPGTNSLEPVDLHDAIRGTVTVARNEWKYVADLEMDFCDDLGAVPCLVNEFNQVVLNMIVNAKHAIEEKGLDGENKGKIRIATERETDFAVVRISDTGAGISPENLQKVFDQFFTTKSVGKGTGQGLSLSRDIIVGKHGGKIDVESEVGMGTTFIIRLPLQVGDGTAEALK